MKVVEIFVPEFEITSGIPVHSSISVSSSQVIMSVVVGFYWENHHRLAEALRSGTASE